MVRTPDVSAGRGPGGTKNTRGSRAAPPTRTVAARPAKKVSRAPARAPKAPGQPAKRHAKAATGSTNEPTRTMRHHELVAAPPSADSPHWTATLADGTVVTVRPIHKEDAELERAFLERLSPRSRRLRFLGQMSEPSDALIRQLTDIDYRRDMAFVALVNLDGKEREIGVSRYSTSADGQSCECAVTISDEWQRRGLGTLLMRHLIDVARSRGLRTMVSLDAADNAEMRDLAAFLGFRRTGDPEDPTQVIHVLDLQS